MLIGVVVGLPAARIRGLPLAAVTLSLAVAVEAVWFDNTDLVSASGKNIKGPTLFGLDLRVGSGAAYPRLAFCLMALVVLIAVALSVAKLRTSRLGAAMLAVRANERSAAAAGINVVVVKLGAIAIAALIAGIGGTLLAYQQTNVSSAQFDAILGLGLFATTYLAGVTSVSGGILAGMLAYTGIVYWFMKTDLHLGGWYDAIAGLGLVLTVIFNPEGIVGPIHLARASRRERRAPAPVMELETGPTNIERPARASLVGAATVLSIRDVTVRYGAVSAVSDVSFDVPEGAIVGLIGPNGAGKTSLIDAVTGFARYRGTVALAGLPLEGLRPHQRTRAGLGRTFQAIELWDDLTVGENVGVGASHRIAPGPSDIDDILGLLGIAGVRDRPAGELSQGQRQLVSIARSLLGRPKVLLLDEPAAGLDTNESTWLGDKLRAVRDRGVTILLVDHDMGLVLSLCDEIRVLNFGVLIASGTPDSVRADAVVSEAYLGSTHSRVVTTPSGPEHGEGDGDGEKKHEVAPPVRGTGSTK